jgi:DNA modification methylase
MVLKKYLQSLGEREFVDFGEVCVVKDSAYEWLGDGTIDLILTDPPFNIARDTNFHTYEKNTVNSYRFDEEKGWDSHSPDDFRELLSAWSREFARVLRPGGSFAVFCADEYLSDLISSLKKAGLKPRRTLTWTKPNAVPVNRKHMMMSSCEYVVLGVKGSKAVFNADIDLSNSPALMKQEIVSIADKVSTVIEQELRKRLLLLGGRPTVDQIRHALTEAIDSSTDDAIRRSVNIYSKCGTKAELCVPNFVKFNSKSGSRRHPTEKPVPLLQYLTELLSMPGDIILDPFAGSASLGEAAFTSGRRAILVEKDEEFYSTGIHRIKELTENAASHLFSS